MTARHDVHQWAGTDPDVCIVCDVDWSNADLTCKPSAGRVICPEVNVGGIQCMSDAGHTDQHWAIDHDLGAMRWNTVDWAAEQAALDQLERTDPDVAAAAASYDRMVQRITGPRTRVGCALYPGCQHGDGLHSPLCPASGQPDTAALAAADHLSYVVTSYMLGDLDGGDVAKAQHAYSAARNPGVTPT